MKGKTRNIAWMVGLLSVASLVACNKLLPAPPPNDQVLDGPLVGLTAEETNRFIKGDFAFNSEIFTSENGLGPLFVATSCGTCHAGDGKGHPFTTLTRFGQSDTSGNSFMHAGGPQLQNRSIYNYTPEQIPAGASSSMFTPPANTGLGFLDAVTDADLLSYADPDDSDGDGISGRPNWIQVPAYITLRPNAVTQNGRYIARFGKKAAAYDLLHQTVNAYNQDMGIVTSYEPKDSYTGRDLDPEISNQTVLDLVAYLKMLKAPVQRNQHSSEITQGKQVFMQSGCGKCHLPDMRTGYSPIEALNNKTFHPYTDLLLHDMGPQLDDGYTEGHALTAEWRTPPLWGLGLSKNSQGGNYFLLHDGRASTIEEAIHLHGGEAAQSATQFKALTTAEKDLVIKFLESL